LVLFGSLVVMSHPVGEDATDMSLTGAPIQTLAVASTIRAIPLYAGSQPNPLARYGKLSREASRRRHMQRKGPR
jgi:hypothetical protein